MLFSVTASVTPSEAKSYRWQKSSDYGITYSDIPIVGPNKNDSADKDTLILTPRMLDLSLDQTWYRVIVRAQNAAPVPSNPGVLTLTPVLSEMASSSCNPDDPSTMHDTGHTISITTQPQDYTSIDDSATFSASAIVTPQIDYTYQWQVSKNGGANFSNILNSSANKNILILPSLSIDDDKNQYRVFVYTPDCGDVKVSNAATLSVVPSIQIKQDPTSQTARHGEATFSVSAGVTRGLTLSYQWQKEKSGSLEFVDISAPPGGVITKSINFDNQADFGDNFRILSDGISNVYGGNLNFSSRDPLSSYTFNPDRPFSQFEIKFTHPTLYSGQHCPLLIFRNESGSNFTIKYDPNYQNGTSWCDSNQIQTNLGAFPRNPLESGQSHIIKMEVDIGTNTGTLTIDGISNTFTDNFFSKKLVNFTHQPNYSKNAPLYSTEVDYIKYDIQSSPNSPLFMLTGLTPESDNGDRYRVVLSAPGASRVISQDALLTVNPTPQITITQQPTDQLAGNSQVSFSVVANATLGSIKSYQWQKSTDGGVNFTDLDSRNFPSTQTSVLSLNAEGPENKIDYQWNGYYFRVIVSGTGDAISQVSDKAKLTIIPVITFSKQPTNPINASNGEVTFEAEAKATWSAPMSYQWQKQIKGLGDFTDLIDSTDLRGSTKTSLNIKKLRTETDDGDMYRIKVSSVATGTMTVYSDPSTLQVGIPVISISSQPTPQTASGERATFSVTASGSYGAQISHQWQRKKVGDSDFTNLSNGPYVSGANAYQISTSQLNLSHLINSENDGDLYRVVLTAPDAGAEPVISDAVSLTVPIPVITITQQPSNQTAVNGAATFNVTAHGTAGTSANLVYQWQVQQRGSGAFVNVGLNQNSYTRDYFHGGLLVHANDDGNVYRVMITTEAGQSAVTSNEATLSVPLPVITITQQPLPQTYDGIQATFAASANVDGGADLYYSWQRQNPNTLEFFDLPGHNVNPLVLQNLTHALYDGSIYRVKITATLGAVTKYSNAVQLTVPIPAINITAHPMPQVADEGRASFSVKAHLSNSANFSRDWQRQAKGTGAYISLGAPDSETLNLPLLGSPLLNHVDNDGDMYRVVITAQNGESVATSDGALLEVPVSVIDIDTQPHSQITASSMAEFFVHATVTQGATLSYQWQKSLDNGVSFSNISGKTSSTLTLEGLDQTNDNLTVYRVIVSATNDAEPVTSQSALLTIKNGIFIIDQPVSLTSTGGNALFSVNASTSSGAALSYQWQRKAKGASDFVNISQPASSLITSLWNFDGQSEFSDNFEVVEPEYGFAATSNGSLYFSNPKSNKVTGYRFKGNRVFSNFEMKFKHPTLYPDKHCPFINFTNDLGSFNVQYDPSYAGGTWCNSASVKTSFGGFPLAKLAGGQDHTIQISVDTSSQTATLTIDGTSQNYTHKMFAHALTNFDHRPNWSVNIRRYSTSVDYIKFDLDSGANSPNLYLSNLTNADNDGDIYRVVLSASGLDDTNSDPATLTVPSAPAQSIVGVAMKNRVTGATLSFYQMTSDGQKSSLIGTTMTDDLGQYTFSILKQSGSVWVESSGGTYRDEVDGSVKIAPQFSSVVPDMQTPQMVPLTPMSSLVATRVLNQAAFGAPISDLKASAEVEVASLFGLNQTSFKEIPPLSDDLTGQQLSPVTTSFALTAFSHFVANEFPVEGLEMVMPVLIEDIQTDGVIDGLNAGQTLSDPALGQTIANRWTSSMTAAANDALNNQNLSFKDLSNNEQRTLASLSFDTGTATALMITSQPVNQSAINRQATFSVVASAGDKVLNYQWQVSSESGGHFSDVSGATSASMSLNNLTETYNGYQYRVVVSAQGSSFKVMSSPATLSVISEITITSQPQNQTASNNLAVFSVTATATQGASLNYQWQESSDGGGTFSDLSGKTESAITLTSPSFSMSGNRYRVQISTNGGTATLNSDAATLTVIPAVSILNQPLAQSGSSSTSSFSVSASVTAGGTLSYQWQKSTTIGGNSFVDISGATGSTLNLSSLNTSDSGYNYRVIVTSNGGASSVTSSAATLTLTPVISIATQPSNQTAAADGTASFSVSASATLGATLSYQWQKSTTSGGNSFSNISGATGNSLSLSGLTSSDTGYNYRVIVSGTGGASSVTSSIGTLTLTPTLSIATQPSNQTAAADGTASFSVTASANLGGTVSYQWQKSTTSGGNSFSDISGATGSTLNLSNLKLSDQNYNYRVVVSGSGGASSVTSSSAALSIPAPVISITSQPTDQITSTGIAIFSVAARATFAATLSYQWQISTDGGTVFTNLSGETSSSLVLSDLSSSYKNYQYQVVVSASGGAQSLTSNAATLTPIPVISITAQPVAQTAINGSATFSVSASVSLGARLYYHWQKSTTSGGNSFSNIPWANSNTLNLTGLTSADNGYNYRLFMTVVGESITQTSEAVLLTVPVITITSQPSSQSISPGGSVTLSVTASVSPSASLSYQWQKSTTIGGSTYADINNATSSSLSLSNLVALDDGYYYRVVINSSNVATTVTSDSALVTVIGPSSVSVSIDFTNNQTVITSSRSSISVNSGSSSTASYADRVMNLSPSTYYKLDETQGTEAHDYSGNFKNGAYSMATHGTATGAVDSRGATTFNGSSDRVTFPQSAPKDFSISVWIKKANSLTHTSDAWHQESQFGNGYNIVDFTYWHYYRYKYVELGIYDDKVKFVVGGATLTSNSVLSNGAWYHLTATRNSQTGEANLYINGVLESSVVAGGIYCGWVDGSCDLGYIGASYYGAGGVPGDIADVAIFNSALSSTEVSNLYSGTSLIRNYTVSGNTATTKAVYSMSALMGLVPVGNTTISSLTLSGSGTFLMDAISPGGMGNLTVNSGSTLSAPPFQFYKNSPTATPNSWASPTWDVFSVSPTPSTPPNGNGRLVLDLTGNLTVNSGGRINMDGKGYPGGGHGPGQTIGTIWGSECGSGASGYSHQGMGAGGAGVYYSGGVDVFSPGVYSSASYGTQGAVSGGATPSNIYGASDFWTKLYLGSGGAGLAQDGGCDSSSGPGGGAIKITAANITNNGTISAKGVNGGSWYQFSGGGGGGGSGGTIYLVSQSTFTNTGTISVLGSGGNGRYRFAAPVWTSFDVSSGTLEGVPYTADAVPTQATLAPTPICILVNGISCVQYIYGTIVTSNGYYSTSTSTGGIKSTSELIALTGTSRPVISFLGSSSLTSPGTFTFDTAYTPDLGYLDLDIPNGLTVVMNVVPNNLRNITVESGGVLTGQAFAFYKNTASAGANSGASPTWDVYSLSPTPSTPPNGNGRLIVNISGTLTVKSGGTVTMDGKGYPGGGNGPGQIGCGNTASGYSQDGMGAGGAGRFSGGSASYGTLGGGNTLSTTYGASDFWTKLYLGSGGAGDSSANDCGPTGGAGGGAISISAAAISNSGTISSKGIKNSTAGGGSGGTIYLNTSGANDNTGIISTAGGSGTGSNWGGNGRIKRTGQSVTNSGSVIASADTIISSVTIAPNTYCPNYYGWWNPGTCYNSYGSFSDQSPNVNGSYGYNQNINNISSVSSLLSFLGNKAPAINFYAQYPTPGTFTFDTAYTPDAGYLDLDIPSGMTVVMNVVPNNLRNITVESGGVLTGQAFAFYKNTASAGANSGASPTWDVYSLSPTPSTPPNGNGRLIVNISGTLTVKSGGTVTMDGKGYPGGGNGPGQIGCGNTASGYSQDGMGAGGAGRFSGGSASYGTLGGGNTLSTTYGASDFWTKLYLGSGGAGDSSANDCGPTGGAGGGAISISAAAISNSGTISSKGIKNSTAGGGSGGTIYLNTSGANDNTGIISTAGGTGTGTNSGGNGRLKISGTSVSNTGTITGVQ